MPQEREDAGSVPPDTDRLRARILVLEDEPIVAIDVADRLTEAGYEIIGPAGTVTAGMDLLAKFGCDAAIIDQDQPHLGGLFLPSLHGPLELHALDEL